MSTISPINPEIPFKVAIAAYNKPPTSLNDEYLSHFSTWDQMHQMCIYREKGSDDLYIGCAGTLSDFEMSLKLIPTIGDWLVNTDIDLVPYGTNLLGLDLLFNAVLLALGLSESERKELRENQSFLKLLDEIRKIVFNKYIFPEEWKVHKGFMDAAIGSLLSLGNNSLFIYELVSQLSTVKTVHVTGHSQGGAIAALLVPIFKMLQPIFKLFGVVRAGLKKFFDSDESYSGLADKLKNLFDGIADDVTFHIPRIRLITFAAPNCANLNYALSMNGWTEVAIAYQNNGDIVPYIPLSINDSTFNGTWISSIISLLTPSNDQMLGGIFGHKSTPEDVSEQMTVCFEAELSKLNAELDKLQKTIESAKSNGLTEIDTLINSFIEQCPTQINSRVALVTVKTNAAFYGTDVSETSSLVLMIISTVWKYREKLLPTLPFSQLINQVEQTLFSSNESNEQEINRVLEDNWKTNFSSDQSNEANGNVFSNLLESIKSLLKTTGSTYSQYAQVGVRMKFTDLNLNLGKSHSMEVYGDAIGVSAT